jgi:hypothetical protein
LQKRGVCAEGLATICKALEIAHGLADRLGLERVHDTGHLSIRKCAPLH